ncbi:Protein of unknown function, partial [Gryllus bimaculatus]
MGEGPEARITANWRVVQDFVNYWLKSYNANYSCKSFSVQPSQPRRPGSEAARRQDARRSGGGGGGGPCALRASSGVREAATSEAAAAAAAGTALPKDLAEMDLVGLVCCLAAGLLYHNTLDAGFVYDD